MDQVQKNQEPVQVTLSGTARIKDYYHTYFESNIGKIKATWNGIKSILYMSRKKIKTEVPKLVIDDKDINDPDKIRITFNSYLTEIAPTLGLASKINPPRVSF